MWLLESRPSAKHKVELRYDSLEFKEIRFILTLSDVRFTQISEEDNVLRQRSLL